MWNITNWNLEHWILLGGALHFCLLPAGALVPVELNFRRELAKVTPLLRHLVWVYYVYIALMIVSFGTVSLLFARPLTDGTSLGRAVCTLIAIFWNIRLVIQLFIFDAKPHLTKPFLKFGYHGLTVIFLYHSVVYALAAILA